MIFNPEVFRAYDIRGVYKRDFDDEFAFALGVALVKYLEYPKGSILIGHDSRNFSPTLAEAVASGVTKAGANVKFIGLATTPFFNFVLNHEKLPGGIVITASHNPPEYGGFKLFGKDGSAIAEGSGIDIIKKLINEMGDISDNPAGTVYRDSREKCLEDYFKFIIAKSKIGSADVKKIKLGVVTDGAPAQEAIVLLSKLDIIPVSENPDISFSFDSDADRLIVKGKNSQTISPDLIVGLLAKDAVKFLSKPKVIHDLRFSRGVTNKFKEWGIKSQQTRVGHSFLREMMIKNRADIGGELSGHIFLKEAFSNEMPLLVILKILRILATSQMTIDELIKPFQTWFNSGEINISLSEIKKPFEKISAELKLKFSDGEISELDGLSISYQDWWLNIRSSHTEPILRLIVEANNKDLLGEKVSYARSLVISG